MIELYNAMPITDVLLVCILFVLILMWRKERNRTNNKKLKDLGFKKS
jgi:hypothetical protein